MVSVALLALACALACLPHRVAATRLTALWPPPQPRSPRSRQLGGPVVMGAVTGLLTAGPGGAVAGALLAVTVARARAVRAARAAATTGAGELAAPSAASPRSCARAAARPSRSPG